MLKKRLDLYNKGRMIILIKGTITLSTFHMISLYAFGQQKPEVRVPGFKQYEDIKLKDL